MRRKGKKLGEGKGSKLGEPCPKVSLSQDRFPIEPYGKGTKLGDGVKTVYGRCLSARAKSNQSKLGP